MHYLDENYSLAVIDNPYKVWVIDNLLKPEIPLKINQEWPNNSDPRWFHGIETVDGKENKLEGNRLAISTYEDMPRFTREVMQAFHSQEFTVFIEKLTGLTGLVSDETLRWSGMRSMPPNSWQLIHSDARENPINHKIKELTVLYYLNENYERDRDEGCLELWDDKMTSCVQKVEPLFNRMVIFVCTDTSYHGVPLVKGERRFLTFSVLKENTTGQENRYRALFVPRPGDPDFIADLGTKRSLI